MAFATIRGARILSLFKCPFNYHAVHGNQIKPLQGLMTKHVPSKSNSSQCTGAAEPACGSHFKAGPCDKTTKKIILPQPAPSPVEEPEIKIKRSMECCGVPCPDALPRFDKLYYQRSDKQQRSYQQTWDECAAMLVRPKAICSEPIKPVLTKRPRKERPQTACQQDICMLSKSKCPFIKMENCKMGRKPPTCLRTTKASNCKKRKSPYPSFSECRQSKKLDFKVECNCLAIPSICEVWAYYNRQHAIKRQK